MPRVLWQFLTWRLHPLQPRLYSCCLFWGVGSNLFFLRFLVNIISSFFPYKKLSCFCLVQCMGEVSTVVKRMASVLGERLKQKSDTRGMQRGPSKSSGLQRLLVVLEGEPFEEILAQPSLGASQLAEVRWSLISL